MIFNSVEFAIFLPIVFIIYWLLNSNVRVQNFFIIIISYFFYGWWDWRFLSLLFLSTTVDYLLGLLIHNNPNKKLLLTISLIFNLGLLGFFKYYNFFTESFIDAFSIAGINLEPSTLKIILPVGISFYTFQSLSYTIDIYRKRLQPVTDPIQYFAFVAFFPQLVAGPIERASHLLPQFSTKRTFSYDLATDGIRQMLWGFLKKILIADNCGNIVNEIFGDYGSFSGSTLVLGAVLFAFQIYCDFSGYSDIAIGCAKLFGFDLMRNFAYPYFSRDPSEFWRRWHISLSSWFRDYLYIPLGGSRVSKIKNVRNTLIVFTLSGFWHGANWTYIIWGFLNALYIIPQIIFDTQKIKTDTVAEGKYFPTFKEAIKICITFSLITFSWIFFRSDNLTEALGYIKGILNSSLFSIPLHAEYLILIFIFLTIEWFNRHKVHILQLQNYHVAVRWGVYYCVILLILVFGEFGYNEFIYFQF